MMKGYVPIWVSYNVAPLCIDEPSGSELSIESPHHMAPLICAIHQRHVCSEMPTVELETGPCLAIFRPCLAYMATSDLTESSLVERKIAPKGVPAICPLVG